MTRKKVEKQRGSHTHGYGSKKKHRGAGSRGGRGMAGSKKHNKLKFKKLKPDHIGKYGFKSLKTRKIKKTGKAINLRDVNKLLGDKKEIDLVKLGFDKVLGAGKIKIKKGDVVKARKFTAYAKDEIENLGGKAVEVQ